MSSENNPVRIDLGCGARKQEGHIGMDRAALAGVNVVCDIERGIPLKDSCADSIYSSFLFEHVGDLPRLFEELFRVCRPGATVRFIVPHYASIGAFKDPTHKSFFTEETMRYFSEDKWYGSDYGFNAKFIVKEIKFIYASRNFERLDCFPFKRILNFMRTHLVNVVHSMEITIETVK